MCISGPSPHPVGEPHAVLNGSWSLGGTGGCDLAQENGVEKELAPFTYGPLPQSISSPLVAAIKSPPAPAPVPYGLVHTESVECNPSTFYVQHPWCKLRARHVRVCNICQRTWQTPPPPFAYCAPFINGSDPAFFVHRKGFPRRASNGRRHCALQCMCICSRVSMQCMQPLFGPLHEGTSNEYMMTSRISPNPINWESQTAPPPPPHFFVSFYCCFLSLPFFHLLCSASQKGNATFKTAREFMFAF